MIRPESPEFTRLGYSPLRRDLVRSGPPLLNALVLVAVLVPLAYIGYRASFTYPRTVDDEGYFLISLPTSLNAGAWPWLLDADYINSNFEVAQSYPYQYQSLELLERRRP